MRRLGFGAGLFGLVAGAVILTPLANSAQAASINDTGADAYWGGSNFYNPGNADVIGGSQFAISSMDVSRSLDGNTLTVTIHTAYAGVPGTSAALFTTYGSLFFAPTWTPTGTASHYSSDLYQANDWTYAFVMNGTLTGPNASGTGTLYSTGTGASPNYYGTSHVAQSYTTTTGKIIMSNVNNNPISRGSGISGQSFYYFRQGQAVQYKPGPGQQGLGGPGSIWTVDAANDIITFSIVDNKLLGDDFALSWAMTCANDVIQGLVNLPHSGPPPGEVPLPGGFILMGSALFGLGGIARWRARYKHSSV
jgi:hypothetical protein